MVDQLPESFLHITSPSISSSPSQCLIAVLGPMFGPGITAENLWKVSKSHFFALLSRFALSSSYFLLHCYPTQTHIVRVETEIASNNCVCSHSTATSPLSDLGGKSFFQDSTFNVKETTKNFLSLSLLHTMKPNPTITI